MNNNIQEHNLFKRKITQLSNNDLFFKKISSSSIKNNKFMPPKLSSKTDYTNNNLNKKVTYKINFSSSIKNRPFKVFYSDNINKKGNNLTPRTNLKRIITSYNSSLRNQKLNNPFEIKNKTFKNIENKNKSLIDVNLSKSSDKSSSLFITENQNNNNKYRKKNYMRISNILDNFGNLIDPLIIPDEDKIFDELQKFNCLTDRFNKKYKNYNLFQNIIENNNTKEKRKENDEINNDKDETIGKMMSDKIKLRNRNKIKSFSKTFYNHNHFKLTLQDKDLLDTLYMTSKEYFDKLNKIKKSKQLKKLKDYQSELLDLVKPIISVYGFNRLKDRFEDIKKQNKLIKNWDFEFLKKLEDNEEMIVNDINYYYNKYLKSESNESNYYSKHLPKKFELNLPNLEFNRVFKIEDEDETDMKEYLTIRKPNDNSSIIKLKKIKDNNNKNNNKNNDNNNKNNNNNNGNNNNGNNNKNNNNNDNNNENNNNNDSVKKIIYRFNNNDLPNKNKELKNNKINIKFNTEIKFKNNKIFHS